MLGICKTDAIAQLNNMEENIVEDQRTKNDLFNDYTYPGLTNADVDRICTLNARNDWGLSQNMMERLIREHKKARKLGDARTMSKIEFRLTDINFHTECRLLKSGKYAEARHHFVNS